MRVKTLMRADKVRKIDTLASLLAGLVSTGMYFPCALATTGQGITHVQVIEISAALLLEWKVVQLVTKTTSKDLIGVTLHVHT